MEQYRVEVLTYCVVCGDMDFTVNMVPFGKANAEGEVPFRCEDCARYELEHDLPESDEIGGWITSEYPLG